jgi:hypothetical protein
MVELRPDPWRADFGSGAEAPLDDEISQAVVDPEVETLDWSCPVEAPECPPDPTIFVDGVMRTELRVMACDGDARAWGLLGSYAAGAVRCDGAAAFIAEDEGVRRALLVGSRIEAPPLTVSVAGRSLVYDSHSVAADSPQGLRRSLQRLMLSYEQQLANRLANEALVFADGPLHLDLDAPAPVVGVVKRMVKSYLGDDHATLLGRLRPGQRTPLFALGNNLLDRYAWYQRLIPLRPSWHELAGLVRCEVRMNVGLDRARRIADRVARHLPSFAGRPGIDPRAPQNLTPVGALEARLKHRLGSSLLIGRALESQLAEVARHG